MIVGIGSAIINHYKNNTGIEVSEEIISDSKTDDIFTLEEKLDSFILKTEINDLTLKQQKKHPNEMTNEERYALDLEIPEGFTEDDLRMLTTMVFNENGLITNEVLVNGEYKPADIMHEYTAQVCLNHLQDDRLPDTIYDDLEYPRYSSSYRSKELAERCQRQYPEQWARVQQSCLLAMNGYVNIPSNVIYESNYESLGTGHFAVIYVDTGYFRSYSYFSYG